MVFEDEDVVLRREILRAYMEQATDVERESEALEWSEALIGDGFEAR